MTCGCCGCTPYFTDEEVQEADKNEEILRKELNTRGHISSGEERKAVRQARGKRKH